MDYDTVNYNRGDYELKDFSIKILVLSIVRTNCYIISNEKNKEVIVIDPADDVQKIIDYIDQKELRCKAILLTHGHFDHIMAGKELAEYYQVSIYTHKAEKALCMDATLNCSRLLLHKEFTIIPDRLLDDQEIISISDFHIQVIHTPGHTEGGICYHFVDQGILFSGDTLFYQNTGRTDFPTGDSIKLLQSIREKLFLLDDDIIVYPGHGEATTIGFEKENCNYLRYLEKSIMSE